MPGDYSRQTFDPRKHYAGVLMQQGRVQLDADWNEQHSIHQHRDVTETRDVVGKCGAPLAGGGFNLTLIDGGRDLQISPGRIYVDGILCELEPEAVPATVASTTPLKLQLCSLVVDGRALAQGDWVELFAQGSNPGTDAVRQIMFVDPDKSLITLDGDAPTVAISPPDNLRLRRVVTFFTQPDYPDPDIDGLPPGSMPDVSSPALPPGRYLAYLDVWQREITALDDPRIREVALGGPDTATRLQTMQQVRLFALSTDSLPAPLDCTTDVPEWDDFIKPTSGLMNARTQPPSPDDNPCQLSPTAGYRRLENQLYRVQIHDGGLRGEATFKWSRDNGSVETQITEIDGAKVKVSSTGKDEVLGFQPGQWVEILDHNVERKGTPYPLVQIQAVSPEQNLITLKNDISAYRAAARKLRRWDQDTSDDVSGQGLIPLAAGDPDATTRGWVELEGGIEVQFEEGTYHPGDYWLIPARTFSGEIEWPPFEIPNSHPIPQPPRGIHHRYCRLALVDTTVEHPVVHDCRCRFPSLNQAQGLCYVGGDGQEVMPTRLGAGDLVRLPNPLVVGVLNPQGCPHPVKVRFLIKEGTGQLRKLESDSTGANVVDATTDEHGLAYCWWDLGADLSSDASRKKNLPSQQVEALWLDEDDNPRGLPIRFNANLSIACQVAYEPPERCDLLADQHNVQDALDRLAGAVSLYDATEMDLSGPPGTTFTLKVKAASRCGAVEGAWVQFNDLSGGSAVPEAEKTHADGSLQCQWTPNWAGAGAGPPQLDALLIEDPAYNITEPRRVRFTAVLPYPRYDPEPVHVEGLLFFENAAASSPAPLANDQTLSLDNLEQGIVITFDKDLDEQTVRDPQSTSDNLVVRGQPTCFVTAEIPFPLTQRELEEWGLKQLVGYRPFILHGVVNYKKQPTSCVVWQPAGDALAFLRNSLALMPKLAPHLDRLLLRLTLKGNFIWQEKARALFKQKTPGGFLDGEALRAPQTAEYPFGLILPSGDGQRGGDFEMWFWLTEGTPPPSSECLPFKFEVGYNLFTNPFAPGAAVVQKAGEKERTGALFDLMAVAGMQVWVFATTQWAQYVYDVEWMPSRPEVTPGTVVLVRVPSDLQLTLCGTPADYNLDGGAATAFEGLQGRMWTVVGGISKPSCQSLFGREAPSNVRLYRPTESLVKSGSLEEGLKRWDVDNAWNTPIGEGSVVMVFVPSEAKGRVSSGTAGKGRPAQVRGIPPVPQVSGSQTVRKAERQARPRPARSRKR